MAVTSAFSSISMVPALPVRRAIGRSGDRAIGRARLIGSRTLCGRKQLAARTGQASALPQFELTLSATNSRMPDVPVAFARLANDPRAWSSTWEPWHDLT